MTDYLPLWACIAFAEAAAGQKLQVASVRTHCVFWKGSDLARSSPNLGVFEKVAELAIAAFLCAPIREPNGDACDSANMSYAAHIAYWQFKLNGQEVEFRSLRRLMQDMADALVAVDCDLADVKDTLIRELSSVDLNAIEPFTPDPDPPEIQLPQPPVVYIASALTGFRDAACEWFWARDVPVVGAVRHPDGTWDDNREARRVVGLDFQRELNARLALWLRAAGLSVFVPHEQFDPDLHGDRSAVEVDLGDRKGVASADVVLLMADYPAIGAGKELVFGEAALNSTVIVSSLDVRTSRLVSGTSHGCRELLMDWHAWPQHAIESVLADLPRHERHSRARVTNVAAAASLVDSLVLQECDSSLSEARAAQLVANPELVPSASLLELQELARRAGRQLQISFVAPETAPAATDNWTLENAGERVERFLTETAGLRTDGPNSTNALLRAMGLRVVVDSEVEGEAQTRRHDDGSIEIRIRESRGRRDVFTIAHEVAHVLIEGPSLAVSYRNRPDARARRIERIASVVGIHLLLPTEWLTAKRQAWAAQGLTPGGLDELERLAKEGGVSIDAAAMRLTLLDPANPTVVARVQYRSDGAWFGSKLSSLPDAWGRTGSYRILGLPAPSEIDSRKTYQVTFEPSSGRTRTCLATIRSDRKSGAIVVMRDFV